MYVSNFYCLPNEFKKDFYIKQPEFGFGNFGEVIYYRTYSRIKSDGTQEKWNDTVIRVVEGIMSIRKDFFIKNNLPWNDVEWNDFAINMADYMFSMKFLPAGRGLWAMGTEYMYERGSSALFNCGATYTKNLEQAL